VQHNSGYSITAVHSAAVRHRAVWHLQEATIHNISNTPTVQHAGLTIPVLSATLSADELTPHWLASITLQNQADFAAMQLGDAITLTLGLTSYALRIDAMSSTHPEPQDTTYSITAVSPLAWLDTPWCGPADFSRATAVLASDAVQDLIGPVQWTLPDWTIPAGTLAIANATPLAAARTIAAAVGAVIESQPDGSTLVRARHPVSPPDYTLPACSHTLSDVVLLASTSRGAPLRGFNRVQVTNTDISTDPTASTDTLEWVPDDTTASAPTAGTVRARLGIQRPVLLVHSGHPSTVIESQGSVTRTETELLEFVAGTTRSQYPADTITAHTWQHADLGELQISSSDVGSITAATPGYSLARISYQTTALQWRVQLDNAAETVQFILIDA